MPSQQITKISQYLAPVNVFLNEPVMKPCTWVTFISSAIFLFFSLGYATAIIVQYCNMEPVTKNELFNTVEPSESKNS